MNTVLRSIFCVSTLGILNFSPSLTYAQISQNAQGNCIYQNGRDNVNSAVTIICNIGLGRIGSLPKGSATLRSKAVLYTKVENLRPGNKSFTLVIENKSPNQTVDIPTQNLSILDNLGNSYELDEWEMFGLDLKKRIPPNRQIRIPYVLSSPIARNASQITFNLNNVWTQPKGNEFKRPLPELQWDIRI